MMHPKRSLPDIHANTAEPNAIPLRELHNIEATTSRVTAASLTFGTDYFHEALAQPNRNHGVYTADLAQSLELLVDLIPEDREVIMLAWRWHGEMKVELEEEFAHTLCYALRDNDKMDILSQGKTYSAEFALKELAGLFGFSAKEQQQLQQERDKFLSLITATLKPGGSNTDLSEDDLNNQLVVKVHSLMTAKIDADSEVVRALLEQRTANAALCKDSYASFLLMHVAMTFDLFHGFSFQKFNDPELLKFELEFIRERCEHQLYQQMHSSFSSFVENRLENNHE